MVLDVNAAMVANSAATEATISAELGSATAVTAELLTGVLPMGADLDSAAFAAALNAAGAALMGAATEHITNRAAFAGAQDLAAATYTATDVISNTALAV